MNGMHVLIVGDNETHCRPHAELKRYAKDHSEALEMLRDGIFTHVCHSGGMVPASSAYMQWTADQRKFGRLLEEALFLFLLPLLEQPYCEELKKAA